MQPAKVKYSIRHKLTLLSMVVAIPFMVMVIYLIYALYFYSNAYDTIVSNMTVVNNYNLNFKEEMDESLYKLVVGYVTFETGVLLIVVFVGSIIRPIREVSQVTEKVAEGDFSVLATYLILQNEKEREEFK